MIFFLLLVVVVSTVCALVLPLILRFFASQAMFSHGTRRP